METQTRNPTFRILRKSYRGRPGFLVSGPRTSIFVETRGTAEHIRGLCRAGLEVTLIDFATPAPIATVR